MIVGDLAFHTAARRLRAGTQSRGISVPSIMALGFGVSRIRARFRFFSNLVSFRRLRHSADEVGDIAARLGPMVFLHSIQGYSLASFVPMCSSAGAL
jgi:hypothetical protein